MGKVVKPGMPAIYPTPVVLVTCKSVESDADIITLGWVGIVCSKPPVVGISIRPSRYSHGLISLSGEFVVNIPSVDIVRAVDQCGMVSGSQVDKFAAAGLTQAVPSQVQAPLIEECPVNLECRVSQIISLGTHDLFLGEVIATHIDEDLLDEKGSVVSTLQAKPIVYSPLTSDYIGLGDVLGKYGFSRETEDQV